MGPGCSVGLSRSSDGARRLESASLDHGFMWASAGYVIILRLCPCPTADPCLLDNSVGQHLKAPGDPR